MDPVQLSKGQVYAYRGHKITIIDVRPNHVIVKTADNKVGYLRLNRFRPGPYAYKLIDEI